MHEFRARCTATWAVVLAIAIVAGCSADDGSSSSRSGPTLAPLVTTALPDATVDGSDAESPSGPSSPSSAGATPDDSAASPSISATTSTSTSTTSTTSTTTTLPPTTTTTLVTEGATVIVANATNVPGAAGMLSEELRARGFTVGDPTNSAGNEEDLDLSKVYIAPTGEAVGRSIAMLMGVPTAELPVPAPIFGATAALGDATVLVMVGADRAGRPLGSG